VGIFDKYGPNTQQVKRFIERVKALTPEQRASTEFEEHFAKSAFGSANNYYVQVASESRYGKDHEEKVLGPASKSLRDATADLDPRFRMRAGSALMALALCDGVMNAEEFSTWYGPLARVIPIDSVRTCITPIASRRSRTDSSWHHPRSKPLSSSLSRTAGHRSIGVGDSRIVAQRCGSGLR
jgi:hypothetical protein